MFIKRVRGGSNGKWRYYLQLAHSYRDEHGKVKHRILCNLGREDEIIGSDLPDKLAKRFAELNDRLIVIDRDKDKIGETRILGPVLAVDAIWKRLKLDKLLSEVQRKYNIKFDLNRTVKLMVLNRLAAPKSKLGISQWQKKLATGEYEKVELQHLYRALDILAENTDVLQRELFETTRSLFKTEVKVVFYDLTTIYFESQQEDEIRRYGYSKDNKTDSVQVVLGVIMSREGMPLGYEIFEGNRFEGKTVKEVLKRLREDFKIERVVFVGDKGILSKGVLDEIANAGYEYIVAAKLPSLPKELHQEVQELASYKELNERISYKELEYDGKRLVLGYNQERAWRDQAMRAKLVEQLTEKLAKDKKGVIAKPAYRKYLKIGEVEVAIDEDKLASQAKWDGFFGFYTNSQELTPQEVIAAYKDMWQIEETFRCLKSTLKLRPIYHWTEQRIRGHIMMSFLSLYVLRSIQKVIAERFSPPQAEIERTAASAKHQVVKPHQLARVNRASSEPSRLQLVEAEDSSQGVMKGISSPNDSATKPYSSSLQGLNEGGVTAQFATEPRRSSPQGVDGVAMSPEELFEELDEIRAVEIRTEKKHYLVRTEISGIRGEILRALGAKIPPFVLKEGHLK